MGWGTKLLLGLIAALAATALILQSWSDARRAELVSAGAMAPDFELEKLDGSTVKLSELRGKVVLIDFWATWCPPCREEMPHFVKLAQEYEDKGLVFVAATGDERADEKTVRRYSTAAVPGLAKYVAWADNAVSAAYQVDSLPTLYFIDREGRIGEAITGYTSEAALRRRIEEALE